MSDSNGTERTRLTGLSTGLLEPTRRADFPIGVTTAPEATSTTMTSGTGSVSGVYASQLLSSTSTVTAQPLIDFQARVAIVNLGEKLTAMSAMLEELNVRLSEIAMLPKSPANVLQDIAERLAGVSQLQSAYATSLVDGYEIVMVYPDSLDLIEVLEALVPLEVEIDRRFKNVYFDFQHIPESQYSRDSFPKSQPLFKR